MFSYSQCAYRVSVCLSVTRRIGGNKEVRAVTYLCCQLCLLGMLLCGAEGSQTQECGGEVQDTATQSDVFLRPPTHSHTAVRRQRDTEER